MWTPNRSCILQVGTYQNNVQFMESLWAEPRIEMTVLHPDEPTSLGWYRTDMGIDHDKVLVMMMPRYLYSVTCSSGLLWSVSIGFWTPLFLSFDMIINLHLVEFKQRLLHVLYPVTNIVYPLLHQFHIMTIINILKSSIPSANKLMVFPL